MNGTLLLPLPSEAHFDERQKTNDKLECIYSIFVQKLHCMKDKHGKSSCARRRNYERKKPGKCEKRGIDGKLFDIVRLGNYLSSLRKCNRIRAVRQTRNMRRVNGKQLNAINIKSSLAGAVFATHAQRNCETTPEQIADTRRPAVGAQGGAADDARTTRAPLGRVIFCVPLRMRHKSAQAHKFWL